MYVRPIERRAGRPVLPASAIRQSSPVRCRSVVIDHEHARDGWRLVQIFAPGVAAFGAAKYYELIFEREAPG